MSIYTVEQILKSIDELDELAMTVALKRIVKLPVSQSMRATFAKIIMGENTEDREEQRQVLLGKDRAVPLSKLKLLAGSDLLEFVPFIIQAALDPHGPFDSRGVLMLAAEKSKKKAYYITEDGISQSVKNEAGMILSMAGFERKSHYDRDSQRPIKAWKIKHGWGQYTLEERIELVYWTIRNETQQAPTQTSQPQSSLKDFL